MKKSSAEEFSQSLAQTIGGVIRLTEWGKNEGIPKALGIDAQRWVDDYLRASIHLPPKERREQRREIASQLAEQGMSTREIAGVLGVDQKTISNDLRSRSEEISSDGDDDVLADEEFAEDGEEISSPEPNPVAAKRKANEDARKAILETPADPKIEEGLHVGDFFELADRIEDDSVDLVFTDPPYDKSSVDLYRKAAKVAARILKPGGSFVAYTGQKYLPEVYGLINNPALRYWWTFAGVHAEGRQMLQRLGVRCGWKPILWYVKGTRGDVSKVLADVVTGAREKSHHEWQQAEAEALHFIEKLCPEGGLVVDFFLGGGTTAVAAQKLGRRWIGFEINQETAAKARSRIEETKK